MHSHNLNALPLSKSNHSDRSTSLLPTNNGTTTSSSSVHFDEAVIIHKDNRTLLTTTPTPPPSSLITSLPHHPHHLLMSSVDERDSHLPYRARILSASLGALLTSLLTTPFDVIKTRLQTQPLLNQNLNNLNSATSKLTAGSIPVNLSSHSHSPIHVFFTPDEFIKDCTHIRITTGVSDFWCPKCLPNITNPIINTNPKLNKKNNTNNIHPPNPNNQINSLGPLSVGRKMIAEEGILSLWRGLAPTLLMAIPSTIIYFAAYDSLRYRLCNLTQIKNSETDTYEALTPLLAGSLARTISTILVSPFELIRTKMQANQAHTLNINNNNNNNSNNLSNNTLLNPYKKSLMSMLIEESSGPNGLRGLWRGVAPTLLRDVPFSGVYWMCYEHSKHRLYNFIMAESEYKWEQEKAHRRNLLLSQLNDINGGKIKENDLIDFEAKHKEFSSSRNKSLIFSSFLSGTFSGIAAAALTHPADIIKTRRQIQMYELSNSHSVIHCHDPTHNHKVSSVGPAPVAATSTRDIFNRIILNEGYKGLFTGVVPRIAKIAPACAIMISSYEAAKLALAVNDSDDN